MKENIKILLEIQKKISRGEYDRRFQGDGDTEHIISPMLIIPVDTLDKIILDALKAKDV